MMTVGQNNGQSKLTEAQVIEARKLIGEGKSTVKLEAKKYNVHYVTMYGAVVGISWKHLSNPLKSGASKIETYPKTRTTVQELLKKGYTASQVKKIIKNAGTTMPEASLKRYVNKVNAELQIGV